MNRKTIVILLLLFACCLSIQNGHGAMVKLSLEELVADADLIIVGTVDSVQSELVEGRIVSFATVSVRLKAKGEMEPTQDEIIVRFPGGMVGDVGMKVEDSPDFKKGEEILLFLQKTKTPSVYMTVGSSQGKFMIRNHIVVRENIPLHQFVERIQRIMHPAK
jgi:hypothetical protein